LHKIEHYTFNETLKDGTVVTVRAARTDDGPRIRRAIGNLDQQTIYSRFFAYKAEVTDAELARITEADFDHSVALLVTIGTGEDEVVIGGGSYIVIERDPNTRSAEVAFTVADQFQNRGAASLLLRHIIAIAREKGVARLEADVLALNRPMLTVFHRSGLPVLVHRDSDLVHVVLSLHETASTPPTH
jgi:RimJ/RimL family protein N-acetyltransferase